MADNRQVIKDWVIQLGFDTTLVSKGQKQVQAMLKRIEDAEQRASGQRVRKRREVSGAEKSVTQQRQKQVDLIKQENTLEARKLSLRRRMQTGKDAGVEVKGYHNTLRSKNPDLIRSRTIELDNKILEAQKAIKAEAEKNNAAKQRAAKLNARIEADHEEALRINKQITQELKRQEAIKSRRKSFDHSLNMQKMRAESGLKNSTELAPISNRIENLRHRAGTAKTTEEFKQLRRELSVVAYQTRDYTKAAKQQARAMNAQEFATRGFSTSLKHLARSYISVFAVMAGSGWAYQVGKEMDAMRASLLATADSAEEAQENLGFLKAAANDLGRDVLSMTRGFNRIAVAAKGAGFSMNEAKEIFLAASEASATYALDAQRTNLVMLAMSQMMSKGRISMEEMSRQLGENLPTAMQAARMATGKSSAELIKLIETGKLLPQDFMIPFARSLRAIAREGGALTAAKEKLISVETRFFNTIKNGIDFLFQQAGVAEALAQGFKFLTAVVKGLGPPITLLVGGLSHLVIGISKVLGPVNQLIEGLGVPGGGLGAIVMLLANVVLINLIRRLFQTARGMWSVTTSTLGAGNAFTIANLKANLAAAGVGRLSRAVAVLKWGLRGLKMALGPLGWGLLAMEGAGAYYMHRKASSEESKYRRTSEAGLTNINIESTINASGYGDKEVAAEVRRQQQIHFSSGGNFFG